MKKLFKNYTGFSMAELMIAGGLMSAVALIGVGLLKDSKKAVNNTLVSTEISNLKSRIVAALSNPRACNLSFPAGTPVTQAAGVVIRDHLNVPIAQVPMTLGTAKEEINMLQISSAPIVGTGSMRIRFDYAINDRLEKSGRKGQKSFLVDIFVNRSAANNALIDGCFADTSALARKAVQNSCTGIGAVYNPAVPPYGTCTHSIPTVEDAAGAVVAAGTCPAGQFLKEVRLDTPPNKVVLKCAPVSTTGSCGPWSYMTGINTATGAPNCVPLSSFLANSGQALVRVGTTYQTVDLNCPGDNALQKINALGAPTCIPKSISRVCPVGQYVTIVTASAAPPIVGCSPFVALSGPCGAGMYLKAINADGSIPVGGCARLEIPASCGGQYVIGGADVNGNPICVKP